MVGAKDALNYRPDETRAPDSRGSAQMPTPLKILYVEDNELVREVTAELLAQEQRQIVACADAEEALRKFSENSFDVVITDVSLPVMSGH